MLAKRIIKPSQKKEAVKAKGSTGKMAQYTVLAVLLVVVLGGLGMKIVALPKLMKKQVSGMEEVKKFQAVAGLKSIEKGLKIYMKLHGEAPDPIHKLAVAGVVNNTVCPPPPSVDHSS